MEDPFERSLGVILSIFTDIGSASIGLIISFLLMLVLLLCSALISGSEVAFFSLSPSDKDDIQNKKVKYSEILNALLEQPKRLLATILIANNFVNIAIVILSSYIASALMPESMSIAFQLFIQIGVVTFLLLLFGEVIPKVYANAKPLALANFMANPIFYLRLLLKPFSSLLVSSTQFIDKRIKKKGHNISVDELSQALELTSDEKTNEDDQKILEGIVNFGNTDVKQVMTSRVDTVALDLKKSFSEVIQTILDSGYSRIPAFEDSFDNIKGVLYIKDILPHLSKDSFDWKPLLRKPFFVPENKKIDDLLKEFQSKKIHLAIVVDEYGGSSGIITLEDILEEIVGEISDEFDDDDLVYSKLDELNYIFEGKIALKDMYRVLSIEGEEFEEAKGEAETLAGLVLELFGKIPKKNEKIRLNDYQLIIDAADKRRVKRVKLILPENQTEDEI